MQKDSGIKTRWKRGGDKRRGEVEERVERDPLSNFWEGHERV